MIAEADGFPPQARTMLSDVGEVVVADLDRQRLLVCIERAEVLWTRLRNRIDAEVLTAARRLQVIATPTTGLNHIALEEAHARGIHIVSLRDHTDFLREVRATAELTLALMLVLLRHIPAAVAHVRDGGWNRDLFKGNELYQKTVGIVGYGRLGQIVGRYLRALDTRVLIADPYIDPTVLQGGDERVSLDHLLRTADIVTLHVNLSDRTHGFFGKREFAQMKQGAYLINTARGELIDEAALVAALGTGRLRAAAVDVVCRERAEGMESHPLVRYAQTHKNLLITPHLGGCTVESLEKSEIFLARQVCQLLYGNSISLGVQDRELP
ncbi:MAG: NAD(P)-dependent oxidoreductase [Candidatus Binatia bacterium]